jgi:hypothetical protein
MIFLKIFAFLFLAYVRADVCTDMGFISPGCSLCDELKVFIILIFNGVFIGLIFAGIYQNNRDRG